MSEESLRPITLGELIDALKLRDPNEDVTYDFGGFEVGALASYRGYYDQLALGYAERSDRTVADLLADCEAAVGKAFMGYKGGEYVMDRSTAVWAANTGRCTDTAILGVRDGGWRTVLDTGYVG